MPKAVQKIALPPSWDIPFDKLVLSQSNVRRIKAYVLVEKLAEDIARRGLLQSLNARPVLAIVGAEDGERAGDGTFGVVPADEIDGAEVQVVGRSIRGRNTHHLDGAQRRGPDSGLSPVNRPGRLSK